MLNPSTDHPSTIPAWIKIHKLPLECWTEEGLSRITSTIGRPLHVDIATAQQQRLDFARVCVEVSANSNLPNCIQIRNGVDSVTVNLEYQWLPPKCGLCKVFGHSCKPKVEAQATNSDDTWQQMGRALGGGGGVLEALTKEVPNVPSGTSFVMRPDKDEVVIDDLGNDTQSETVEDPGVDCSDPPVQTLTAVAQVPFAAASGSDPFVQAPSAVTGFSEMEKKPLGLKHELLVSGSINPPDPPDIKEGNGKQSNQKKQKQKKGSNGSKGGASGSHNKGR